MLPFVCGIDLSGAIVDRGNPLEVVLSHGKSGAAADVEPAAICGDDSNGTMATIHSEAT